MAIVNHEHHEGGPCREPVLDSSRVSGAPPVTREQHRWLRFSNRMKWILAGMMVGAAAGWIAFQAFVTLITLD